MLSDPKALNYFEAAQKRGESLAQEATQLAIKTDCLRRAGRFSEALQCAEEALRRSLPEMLAQMREYQKKLSIAQDRACHTIKDAIESAKAG